MLPLIFILTVAANSGEIKLAVHETESPVSSLLWCGASIVFTKDDEAVEQDHKETRKVLFTLTDKGHIWKSTDYGHHWFQELEDTIFENLQISPADSRVIYLFGTNGTSFKSSNCGRSYNTFKHDSALYDFKLNKMDHKWIMAFKDRNCNTKKDSNCKEYYKKTIYASKDGGETWMTVLDYVREAAWQINIQNILSGTNCYNIKWYRTRGLLLVILKKVGQSYILIKNIGQSTISYSDDYFQNTFEIQSMAYGFFQTNFYIFVLAKEDASSEGFKLLISPAYLERFTPTQIQLPIQLNCIKKYFIFEEHSFTILDTSEGQIFISVSHTEENQKLTNIYVSDFRGFKFSLSLLHNVRSLDTGNCDFERILGMDGVYIANVYDHSEVDKQRGRENIAVGNLEQYKRSFISYDKGGNWHPIRSPLKDSQNQSIKCAGDCSLHLRGRTENSNPIYSSEGSPGIAMGVGNTGLYLSQHEMNTYLSRDGGHEWYEVRQGSHMYEIGDRGGIILMAKDDKPTDEVIYSWDEGLSWQTVKLNVSLQVQNIVTEPSNMEQKFLVYGQSSKMTGVVIAVDFYSLNQRVCSGIWDPTMPESDYEFWIPRNYENGKCVFGRKMKFIRRKREAHCFNQEETDKRYFIESCECVEDDWECDFGFYRKIEGGPCTPISEAFEDDMPDVLKPPDKCLGTWQKTKGYRKVSGDYCQGGVDLGPTTEPCPGQNITDTLLSNEQSFADLARRSYQRPPPVIINNKQPVADSSTTLKILVVVMAIIIVILLFKEKLIGLMSRVVKKSPQKGQAMRDISRKNYEKLSLFQNEDEEEQSL